MGEYSFDRQRGSSAGKIDRGTDVTYHTSHDGRCQSTVSESAAEGPGFSITWDFYFKTSNTVPIEVNLNSKGLVSIEQYQVHEGEIHGLKGDVHELDGRLKELNADLNAINVDISTKETNLSKKSTGVKNLNNVIENGCFTINPDVTTECLPIYEWLTLLVMNSGFGGIIQIAFVVDGSKMFARTYNAGGAGWSEWRQVF
nr:pyocin knob domain-containing protein [uncultured Anaerostipes sp.]